LRTSSLASSPYPPSPTRDLHDPDTLRYPQDLARNPLNPDHLAHAELMVFADYNSFELTDEDTRLDEPFDEWVNQLLADQIAARPGWSVSAPLGAPTSPSPSTCGPQRLTPTSTSLIT